MEYYFKQQKDQKQKQEKQISCSMDLISEFKLLPQYKRLCSLSADAIKLPPNYENYLKDIPGKIDITPDKSLRESLHLSSLPPIINLAEKDLKVVLSLDNDPVDLSMFDFEDVTEEEFAKSLEYKKQAKFIIKLPSISNKPASTSANNSAVPNPTDRKRRNEQDQENITKSQRKA